MLKLNATGIVILLLVALNVALLVYIVLRPNKSDNSRVEKRMAAYEREKARTDSLIKVLDAGIDSIRKERKELKESLQQQRAANQQNKEALQFLNFYVDELKTKINENRPNFVDSNIVVLDSILPE